MESSAINIIQDKKFVVSKSKKRYHDFFNNKYNNINLLSIKSLEGGFGLEALVNHNGVYCDYQLNTVQDIDSHFTSLHSILDNTGFLLVSFESQAKRRSKLIANTPLRLGILHYYTFDFLIHRVIARLNATQSTYLKLTKGKNQVLSVPEVLGRLIAAGFDIVDYTTVNEGSFVLATKGTIPTINRQKSHGPLIKLNRIGFRGQSIRVFKLRTMRPYSEHLQQYLQDKHGTIDGDKIISDFRITGWGKVLRKYWLDELPMLINLIRGDIKLIGVRPLSHTKFYSYPKELQETRVKVKPGLLPPYYADMPKNSKEFFDSEARYTEAYLKAPFKTDMKYFLKIVSNIMLKGARSK